MFNLKRLVLGEKERKICSECKQELTGSIVSCDSVCGKQFHIKCVRISSSHHMKICFFICDDCGIDSVKAVNDKLKKIVSMFNIYDEQAKRNGDSLEEIRKELGELKICIAKDNDEMKKKFNSVNVVASENNNMTYAQRVKAKNNNAVVIVKPKNSEQKSNETIIDIKSKIDPVNLKIERVRNIPAV